MTDNNSMPPFLIPLVGLVGVVIGGILTGWWGDRRERQKRRAEIVSRGVV